MVRLLPKTRLDWGLEALSLVGLWGSALLLIVSWPQIPAAAPGHYDAAGNVTRYDPKSSLWGLVGVNAGLYALISAVTFFPKRWNLPGTAADRPRQLELARTMVYALKAFVIWLFNLVLWLSVRVAQGAGAGLPWWVFAPRSVRAARCDRLVACRGAG